MPHPVLYESERYYVTHGGEGPLVVALPNYRKEQSIEAFGQRPWCRGPLEEAGFSWICVQPEKNDWFQHPDFDNVMAAIAGFTDEPPVLFGASMGGYAAWFYSRNMNACAWLAVAGNCRIDTTQKWDNRCMEARREVEATHGFRPWHINPVPNGTVVYDSLHDIDRRHARSIGAYNDNIRLIDLPGFGHSPLQTMKANGTWASDLRQLIGDMIHPSSLAA